MTWSDDSCLYEIGRPGQALKAQRATWTRFMCVRGEIQKVTKKSGGRVNGFI